VSLLEEIQKTTKGEEISPLKKGHLLALGGSEGQTPWFTLGEGERKRRSDSDSMRLLVKARRSRTVSRIKKSSRTTFLILPRILVLSWGERKEGGKELYQIGGGNLRI